MSDRVITYTSDIISEVADKFDIDEKTVRYVYEAYVAGLRNIANYTDACAIRLPYLGAMYINYYFLDNEITLMEHSEKPDLLKLEAYKKKRAILRKTMEEYPNKEGMRGRFLPIKKGRLAIKRFNGGKTLSEIEDFQNERNSWDKE